MSTNYKEYKFSDLIEEVEERNTSLEYGLDDIVGVTIEKRMIPTIANLTQTALDKFYIVKPDTFVYNPRTHGVKLGMGYNDTNKTFLTSWNNVAFRVKEDAKRIVLSKYLWIYFNRPEWDRQTNFMAWGSSTIVFAWNDFLSIKIKLPDLKEQEKIVNTYNAITKRIQLKQKINENLEKTAQCLFDKYFKEYNKFYEKEELKILPDGWKYSIVGDFCKDNIKSLSSNDELKKILYLDTGSITNNRIDELQIITESEGFPSRAKRMVYDNDIVFSTIRPNLRHYGIIRNPENNMIVSTGFSVLHNQSEKVSNEFLYMWITNDATLSFLQSIAENSVSTYPSINSDDLMNIKIIIPANNILSELNEAFRKIFLMIDYHNREISKLQDLKYLVISCISGI